MPGSRKVSGWNKDKIVRLIKKLKRGGEDLSYNRMARTHQGLLAAANYHFGSWGKAVEAAGLDYANEVRRIPKWTKEKILDAIRVAHKSGADLSWTCVTKDRRYSALAYAAIRDKQFGSWDAALGAAGIDPAGVRRYEAWSEERVVRSIKERKRERKALNSKAMQDDAPRLFNAALNYFGGWDKALVAAGIKPEKVYKRRRWSKEIIKDEIKGLHKAGEDLAAPNMRKKHSALYSAACKYYGSWTDARRLCGVRKKYRRGK
jgi:hypothetical protein